MASTCPSSSSGSSRGFPKKTSNKRAALVLVLVVVVACDIIMSSCYYARSSKDGTADFSLGVGCPCLSLISNARKILNFQPPVLQLTSANLSPEYPAASESGCALTKTHPYQVVGGSRSGTYRQTHLHFLYVCVCGGVGLRYLRRYRHEKCPSMKRVYQRIET